MDVNGFLMDLKWMLMDFKWIFDIQWDLTGNS